MKPKKTTRSFATRFLTALTPLLAVFIFINALYAFKTEIIRTHTKGWSLLDESGNPLIIRGVCYSPTPIGRGVWDMNLYSDDPSVRFVDAEKMQQMGANTLRMYHPGSDVEGTQKFIRQLYKLYSMYTIFPLPLEMQGADYSSAQFRKTIKKDILKMVREYKDTPGIVVWLLGNEIDYFFTDDKAYWDTKEIRDTASPYRKSCARAKIVFDFANEIAREIKEIDKNHPVGLSLGKLDYFGMLKDSISNIDFIGLNYYQGKTFNTVWNQTRKVDKPVLITEFGYDSYNTKIEAEDEEMQAKFIVSLWNDILKNTSSVSSSAVSLGGCIFEWTDEWWKAEGGDPSIHDTNGSWVNPSWPDFVPDKPNVQEEWFGVMKLEKSANNNSTIDTRVPKKIYFKLKESWAGSSAPIEYVEPETSSVSSAPDNSQQYGESAQSGYSSSAPAE